MKTASARRLGRAAVVLVMAMAAHDLFGQPVAAHWNEQVAIRGTERQEKIREAVTMTIVAALPAGRGYLVAWGLGERPTPSSVLNCAANDVVANTTTVPVVPGGGNDFTLFSFATTHVVVDVLGYFAASNATRLDCTTVHLGHRRRAGRRAHGRGRQLLPRQRGDGRRLRHRRSHDRLTAR